MKEDCLVVVQGEIGLLFWPKSEVASITPAFKNRWRIVHKDGSVAHRPIPPPEGPWVALDDSFIAPQWMERTDEGWKDPAGFLFPLCELPAPPPVAEEPLLPDLPFRQSQIIELHAFEKWKCKFEADLGSFVWKMLPLKAARLVPDLLMVDRGLYCNLRRVRATRTKGRTQRFLCLDNGLEYRSTGGGLAKRMGLQNLTEMQPYERALYGNYQVRDWPFELATASGELLRKHFRLARTLIANLVWQRLLYRRLGIEREWADTHRGFWYQALVHTLYRAGFLAKGMLDWPAPEFFAHPLGPEPRSAEGLYLVYFNVMANFIPRFFTYREFGYKDIQPDAHPVGKLRPEVVLIVEKESVAADARRLAEEFGVSLCILSGQPTLQQSEFLALDLLKVVRGPVRIIAFVDYDPAGWIIAESLADQLRDYGCPVDRVDFLIRQECFSEEEKRLYASPLEMPTAAFRTKAEKWVKKSGGVNGELLGIHCNHVQPYERVRELFTQLL